ncbi:hypothetical protein EJ06DRAFT_557546 [Trichodelitschia bisporula]|uniref:Alcohol acetyltransferase n=1 Tax=Trichodelitschia bisporula TaxID=703511 RepID=A0A6G1HSZ3_9PEZI|nr:hypothetical protein EJ06DRAFT_557546 [Trichodelitschia bisporula]
MSLGATTAKPLIARPVGQIESYSTSRHNLGFYRYVGQTARYTVRRTSLKDTSLESAVEHAIAQTILAHSILQVGIVGEETRTPHFVYLPAINLSQLLSWEHFQLETPADRDSVLQRVLETRHSTSWPDISRRPGYHFIVLCPDVGTALPTETLTVDIVFAYHHGYGDGPSGTILHRTLLRALNSPGSVPSFDPSSHVLTISTRSPLPSPQEALINFRISWLYFIKALWTEFAPSFLKLALLAPALTGKPITPHPDNTRIRLLSFSAHILSDMLQRCREHCTTLTPLLHILVLYSLAKRLPVTENYDGGFTSVSPISLRRLLSPDGLKGFNQDENMGVVLVGQSHRFAPQTIRRIRTPAGGQSAAEDLIWELASSLCKEIKRKVASLPNDDVGLMSYVSDWNERWRKLIGTSRENTWEVSNVGATDFERKARGRLTGLYFRSPAMSLAQLSRSVRLG